MRLVMVRRIRNAYRCACHGVVEYRRGLLALVRAESKQKPRAWRGFSDFKHIEYLPKPTALYEIEILSFD